MRLNVSYASGDAYAKIAGISMISLFENNKEFDEIYVYYIDDGISTETKSQLKEIVGWYGRDIIFINFECLCKPGLYKDVLSYNRIIFSKLFLYQIEEVDKIIYIDCDMIISGSFYQLWQLDLNKYLIAGVRMPTPIQYKKYFSSGNNEKYINGGFIVFNTKKWREKNMFSHVKEFMEKFHDYVYIEENIICNICKSDIYILGPEYNLNGLMIKYSSKQIKKLTNENSYYTQSELNKAQDSPIVIHYSSEIYERPWYKNCNHPLKDKYFKYMGMSPWKDMELEISSNKRIKRKILDKLPFELYVLVRKFKKVR